MQVITKEQMERRKQEIEQPQIDSLIKKAQKTGGRYNVYHMILESKYGISGDYSEHDYGEPQND